MHVALASCSNKVVVAVHCASTARITVCKTPPHVHSTPEQQLGQASLTRCRLRTAAKRGAGGEGEIWKHLGNMADKYIVSSSSSKQHPTVQPHDPLPVQGIHILLSTLVLIWLASSSSSSSTLLTFKLLSLEHSWAKWWSIFTDAFCSSSSELLARNLFLGYMFGRVVENSESTAALWLTYLLSAAGGSTAAWILLPKKALIQGCACTGALFGLFTMATIFNRRKLWHWQRVFELAVLLPFVCQQLLAPHAGLGQWLVLHGQRVGAWVPLFGGLVGAAVAAAILALVRLLSSAVQQQQRQQQQQRAATAAGSAPGQPAPAGEENVSLLLTKALAQMLKRVL